MKKFVLAIILTIWLFCTPCCAEEEQANAEEQTYYRVVEDDVYLYKTQSLENSVENIYFKLPKSYFVKLISNIDEQTLYVVYDGIEGYVSVYGLQLCYSTPIMPYATNQTVDTIDVCNIVVYSCPTESSQFLGFIPFNATQIKFFGQAEGTEVAPNMGNNWLFVRYQSLEQGTLLGFVYEPLLKNKSEFTENTEEVLTTPPEQAIQTSVVPVSTEFKNTDSLLLIIGLSFVAIIILYLLFRPERRKKAKQGKTNTKRPQKQLSYIEKHTENNEFDFWGNTEILSSSFGNFCVSYFLI